MLEKEQTGFQIKGHRDGLLITVDDGDWHQIKQGMFEHIRARQSFYKGARVVLDVRSRAMTISEISSIRDHLSDLTMSLIVLLTTDIRIRAFAKDLGIDISFNTAGKEARQKPIDTRVAGENAVVIKKTLRSGYQVVSEGHVVVVGGVNPGAEIIAGGSIIVWGKLRGMVHAVRRVMKNQSFVPLIWRQHRCEKHLWRPLRRSGKESTSRRQFPSRMGSR